MSEEDFANLTERGALLDAEGYLLPSSFDQAMRAQVGAPAASHCAVWYILTGALSSLRSALLQASARWFILAGQLSSQQEI